jgi:predicted DNA-binding protein with PD1-like motif
MTHKNRAQPRTAAVQPTAIGAFSDAVLACLSWERKDYLKIPVRKQVEVTP